MARAPGRRSGDGATTTFWPADKPFNTAMRPPARSPTSTSTRCNSTCPFIAGSARNTNDEAPWRTTALAGMVSCGSSEPTWISSDTNCPCRNSRSLFSNTASTRPVRDPGSTAGATELIRASIGPPPARVAITLAPTRMRGKSTSATFA